MSHDSVSWDVYPQSHSLNVYHRPFAEEWGQAYNGVCNKMAPLAEHFTDGRYAPFYPRDESPEQGFPNGYKPENLRRF